MKALSFTQPWLEAAIFRLGKRIENRQLWRHGCSYRGPILLHAAKSTGTRADFDETVRWILGAAPSGRALLDGVASEVRGRWVPSTRLVCGAIVGRARIDGTISTADDLHAYAANVAGGAGQHVWWMGGFALVLSDVERIADPIAWKGALGLFDVASNLDGSTWTRP